MANPIPKPPGQRVRRNVQPPSKADRRLPAKGRTAPAPEPPIELGEAGRRWWNWAWSTPQATTWTHEGFFGPLTKRAELEDLWHRATVDDDVFLDASKIVPLMLRYDESFGLTPKSAAQLHLYFDDPVPDEGPGDGTADDGVTDIRSRLSKVAGS